MNPSVTTLSDGSYVVTWQSLFDDNSNTWIVAGQHYAANGTAIGNEFQVNATAPNNQQILPDVSSLPNGNFVVTWTAYGVDNADGSGGVYAQEFDANGNKIGSQVQVNDYTPGNQTDSEVTGLHNGGYAVAYDSYLQDGSGYGIALRFFGAGPAPQYSSPVATADTGATVQDHAVTVDVLANDSDPNAGAVLTLSSVSVPQGEGTASIVNNQLAFDPGHAFDYLAAGQTAQVVVSYTALDQFGQQESSTATITVTGTNDVPVIMIGGSDSATGTVTDTASATTLTTSGTLSFTDPDLTDTHVVSVTPSNGDLGTLTAVVSNDTTGSGTGGVIGWNYSVSEAQAATLAAGQTKVDTFVVTVNDGHGGTTTENVSVTINGANDAPVITVGATDSATGTVTDTASATTLTTSGTLSFTDPDLTDTHVVSVTPSNGDLGTLTAVVSNDTTGSGTGGVIGWNYSVSEAQVASLAEGQTQTDTFTVTVDDGHGGTTTENVSVTIDGTNEAPVVTGGIGPQTARRERRSASIHRATSRTSIQAMC